MSIDLTTRYLGLELQNPLVAAASPLTGDLTVLRKMEEAGAAAVVLPSLFEEQIDNVDTNLDELYHQDIPEQTPGLNYHPDLDDNNSGISTYLQLVRDAAGSLTIPVIASLNGSRSGGWVRFAHTLQEAGANAIELNLDLAITDPSVTAEQVEQGYLEIARSVRKQVSIPIGLKIGPYFSSFANFAQRIEECGVEGLILFNRYPQPDIDVRSFKVRPKLSLSQPADSLLSLRWAAVLRSQHPSFSLAANTGIHTWEDCAKLIMAGADVIQLASAIILNGPGHFKLLLAQLRNWMEEIHLNSLQEVRAKMQRQPATQTQERFERVNYAHAFTTFDLG